jgi:D-3-phosphoglycerate dehydrogenase
LIDESALKTALDERCLGGAGLDVFENEPYTGPLTGNENVVLTMHMGSYAKESRIRMETEAVQNLLSGLDCLAD